MTIDELLAKQAIAETLYRYCRSMDRMDTDVYDTVFVPGASLHYGVYFDGTAEEFRTWVWAAHDGMQGHSHQITNLLAVVDPGAGTASSEAYVTVCLRTQPDPNGVAVDIVERGRYLDRWTRTEAGGWRIAERRYCADVQHIADASGSPAVDLVRDRNDPSYAFIG
jgi:hypothetical protein